MSNNYLQFCEALTIKSPEEEAWLRHYMDAAHPAFSAQWDRDTGAFVPLTPAAKFWEHVLDETQDDEACFDWRLTELEGERCWVFYSEDHAVLDHVAKLVQHFFKTMRPEGKDGFALSWAETCDKSQPGQFGGGACMVTRDKIHWLNTWQWIDELAQQLHVE